MSGTGTRLTRNDALEHAAALLRQIQGEAHVVGSLRRRCEEIGDIELIVHREAQIRFEVATGGLFDTGCYVHVKGGLLGGRYWQIRHSTLGFNVDLFRFDNDNRGSIMLIRTGPAAFSKRFVTALLEVGRRHKEGYVRDGDGRIIRCPTEAMAFKLAGMREIPPEERR